MTTERAVLAGGCFWGQQDLIRKLPSVIETRVGYTGGDVTNATYRSHGTHAEGIEIIFDTERLVTGGSWNFSSRSTIRPPRTGRGSDVGNSYRSAIYYVDEEQKRIAEDTIADVNASGLWPGEVVTEVEPVGDFWEAEPERLNYLERYPSGLHLPLPAGRLGAAPAGGRRIAFADAAVSAITGDFSSPGGVMVRSSRVVCYVESEPLLPPPGATADRQPVRNIDLALAPQ
jgi:peptide-methionine (S)-S-oxide reductase